MKTAKWAAWHAMHWAVLYGAFVAQMDGAMYVLKFLVWTMAPLSCLLMADAAVKNSAKSPPQPTLAALNWLQSWATLGLLVWHGHIASGLAWLLAMLFVATHQDMVKKLRKSQESAAAAA